MKGEVQMGFILKVDGPNPVDLGIDHILTLSFDMDTPNDSNARSTDMNSTLLITGKILTALDGAAADSSINLAKWSKIPAEDMTAYRNLEIEVINASQVVRKFTFPHAFVVDYTEDFGSDEGVGTFTLKVRQKKDKTDLVGIEGGWSM